MSDKYMADNRENVVEFIEIASGEVVAWLDRESGVGGAVDLTTWNGSGEVQVWAMANGYADEIAAAIWV